MELPLVSVPNDHHVLSVLKVKTDLPAVEDLAVAPGEHPRHGRLTDRAKPARPCIRWLQMAWV
jgi:hypothetical protein